MLYDPSAKDTSIERTMLHVLMVSVIEGFHCSCSILSSVNVISFIFSKQVTGIPIGFVVRVMFALIASIVVSLYGSWVLSLITLPAYVFLIGAFFCNTKFSQFYSKKYINEHLINSNNMAIESIENVQSVGTLGVADIFTSRYDQLISPAYK